MHIIIQLSFLKFDFNKSVEILVMVVLGGMGNLKGSIIADYSAYYNSRIIDLILTV